MIEKRRFGQRRFGRSQLGWALCLFAVLSTSHSPPVEAADDTAQSREATAEATQQTDDWAALETYLIEVYRVRLDGLPDLSPRAADLARNTALLYGFAIADISGDAGGLPERLEVVERLKLELQARLDALAPPDREELTRLTKEAMWGQKEREATQIVWSLGGLVPESPIDFFAWRRARSVTALHPSTVDPGAMAPRDPRREEPPA